MKIIGKTDEGLLLSATTTEVANLIGFAYDSQLRGSGIKLEPGTEIDVAGMFNQLYKLANAQGQLAKLAAELRAYADRLEVHDPVVPRALGIELPTDPVDG